ncbi:hypothetical protein ACLOJK_007329 [Asimina triloba]
MAQGRGSAAAAAALTFLLGLFFLSQIAHAAVYTVGDSGGWGFNVVGWPKGKSFKAGDVLVFKYAKASHNVVAVNANGYKGCSTPSGAKVSQTGNDRITLARGPSYFICNFPGHCEGGMKIAVTAA